MPSNDRNFVAGLVVLAGAGGLGLLGFALLLRSGVGLSSQGAAISFLISAAVLFVVGLILVGSGHSDIPPRFCNRCGAIVPGDAEVCPSCGRELTRTTTGGAPD